MLYQQLRNNSVFFSARTYYNLSMIFVSSKFFLTKLCPKNTTVSNDYFDYGLMKIRLYSECSWS